MKVAWIDCETTGLDPQKNGIIQLAMIIEIDHVVVERAEFMMNPVGKEFDEGALRINGYTKEALDAYPPSLGQKAKIEEFFAKFVEKFDKNDKFIAAGYNVAFDFDFLQKKEGGRRPRKREKGRPTQARRREEEKRWKQ